MQNLQNEPENIFLCMPLFWVVQDLQKCVFQQVEVKCLWFKTNRDEKSCLSLEIEVPQVEKIVIS
jgi:hypothetical protein